MEDATREKFLNSWTDPFTSCFHYLSILSFRSFFGDCNLSGKSDKFCLLLIEKPNFEESRGGKPKGPLKWMAGLPKSENKTGLPANRWGPVFLWAESLSPYKRLQPYF
jgi:hypothetical protein